MKQKIIIGSDHAGFDLKEKVEDYLKEKGHEVIDVGTHSDERADYPDFAHPLAEAVERGEGLGIVICGSANGVNMAANKHAGIRAAIAWTPEIASLARQHNDANVLSLPARFISEEEATSIVDSYLDASFEGGRHQTRVDKIAIKEEQL